MANDPYSNFPQAYDGLKMAIDTLNQADSYLSRLASWEKTMITGLQLEYVNGTSIKVKKGAAYVQSVGANSFNLVVVSADITVSSISLGNHAWGHVYLYDNAGTAAVEVVTTAPTNYFGTAWQKTSVNTRRYLGSVKTDGSGNIYNFIHYPQLGLMRYRADQSTGVFLLFSGGTSATEATVNAGTAATNAGIVPFTSRLLLLRAVNSSNQAALFGTSDDSAAPLMNALGTGLEKDFHFPLDSSQALTYKIAAA